MFVESYYKLHLKDLSKEVIRQLNAELITRLNRDPVAQKTFCESLGLDSSLYSFPHVLEVLNELFPDTPVKLLQDVFEALQLHDLVDLWKKLKPRVLRPALPLEEIRKVSNASRRTRFYKKAAVLIVDNKTFPKRSYAQKIGSFFKDFNSESYVTTVSASTAQLLLSDITQLKEMKRIFQHGTAEMIEGHLKGKISSLQQHQQYLQSIIKEPSKEEERSFQASVTTMVSESEIKIELFREMRRMKEEVRNMTVEEMINQRHEELQTEWKKMVLDKWMHSIKGWLKSFLASTIVFLACFVLFWFFSLTIDCLNFNVQIQHYTPFCTLAFKGSLKKTHFKKYHDSFNLIFRC